MELYKILERPVITEKSTAHGQSGAVAPRVAAIPSAKYTFRVAREANKIQIREAVEKRFNVTVLAVNTMTVRARERGIGQASRYGPGLEEGDRYPRPRPDDRRFLRQCVRDLTRCQSRNISRHRPDGAGCRSRASRRSRAASLRSR